MGDPADLGGQPGSSPELRQRLPEREEDLLAQVLAVGDVLGERAGRLGDDARVVAVDFEEQLFACGGAGSMGQGGAACCRFPTNAGYASARAPAQLDTRMGAPPQEIRNLPRFDQPPA